MGNAWLERELEDFIWDNPESVADLIDDEFTRFRKSFEFVKLGRQVPCPGGVIDLIFACANQINIVELKAVRASMDALGQVSRYKMWVKQYIDHCCAHDLYGFSRKEDKEILRHWMEEISRLRIAIIAPSFDRDIMKVHREEVTLIRTEKYEGRFLFSAVGTAGSYLGLEKEGMNECFGKYFDIAMSYAKWQEAK